MKQFLDSYGNLPEVIGEFDIDTSDAEMCFVQYLPVFIPDQSGIIPDNLIWTEPLVLAVINDLVSRGVQSDGYIYLTVKRLYGSGNREGWHCDGFGTDDINYIWYDSHPTEFYKGAHLELPHSHSDSMSFMEGNIRDPNDKMRYPVNTLLRLTQSCIHRVNPEVFTGLRTFVKISFSDSKYNLKGNAHNYSLYYNWDMVERGIERNHPIGEEGCHMLEFMSWKKFYRNYLEITDKVPSYRLGQHFINLFIKDEELPGLWNETNQVLAINQCLKVIEKYQWDMEALPIVKRSV